MMGLLRRGPSIVAVKSNTAVPVKETVFIATAMPLCRNGWAGVWKHHFVCIEIRTWKSLPMLQGVSKLYRSRLNTFKQHLWGTITIWKKNLSITHDATVIARSIVRLASNASLTCDVGWRENNTPASACHFYKSFAEDIYNIYFRVFSKNIARIANAVQVTIWL